MNRYVFYNSTNGDIYWVKTLQESKAHQLCNVNHSKNMACILESELSRPVLNHMTDELDLSTTPYTVRKAQNKGVLSASQNAKHVRDALLLESDWTQGADSPLSDAKKAEWATYRQALRDFDYHSVTQDFGHSWPTKPN